MKGQVVMGWEMAKHGDYLRPKGHNHVGLETSVAPFGWCVEKKEILLCLLNRRQINIWSKTLVGKFHKGWIFHIANKKIQ